MGLFGQDDEEQTKEQQPVDQPQGDTGAPSVDVGQDEDDDVATPAVDNDAPDVSGGDEGDEDEAGENNQ